MARIKIDLPRAQVEALLEFEPVRQRFARAHSARPRDELPTFSAAELAIEAVPVGPTAADDVPELDLTSLEILPADEK